MNAQAAPKLYADLSSWWHIMSSPVDYAEEAAFYRQAFLDASATPPVTMLELGSGGGNNASHLKADFDLTLVDLSPGMLALSRTINPECEHILGDMRSVRLGRQFDAVFIHDAIMYMTTEADLRATMETAFVHCRPGGVAVFVPDQVRETFTSSSASGGHDGSDRAMRYVQWIWDPNPNDTTYVVDFAYLLRDEDGRVRVEHDRHEFGIFAQADWLRLLGEVGFSAKAISLEHSEIEPGTCRVFVATKPAEG